MSASGVQKIISSKPQPREGYAVVQQPIGNASGYDTLPPPVNKGLSIAQINTLYNSRFDRPRYYSDTPSGLPY